MPNMQTDLPPSFAKPFKLVPSIVPSDIPALSDDECLLRLARALKDQASEDHDSDDLDEVARLIGRLAVAIE